MAFDYLALRAVHQTAVALSLAGFVARGLGTFSGAGWVRSRAARTLPHVVDSVLLLSALAMLATLHLSPTQAPWLLAKIGGLLAYIGLGVLALRPGRPMAGRVGAWVGALVVVAWIVSVAITKQPLGLLAFVGTR